MGHAELQPEDIDQSIGPIYGAIKRTWSSFCATSSIHGLKYTRDDDSNRFVRGIWIILTIIMFICAIVMVITFYIDYRSNPTRMNVENDHAPISAMLFPSVTICPEMSYNIQRSKDSLGKLKMPRGVTVDDVLAASEIGYGFINDDNRFDPKDIELMESVVEMNNLTTSSLLQIMQWNCNDLLYRCRYNGHIEPCDRLFQVSRTFWGHCCSFNLNQTGLNFTQRHAFPGWRNGLSIVLYHNDISSEFVRSYSYGFKLLLNEHQAFPSAHAVAKFIPLNQEIFTSVRTVETFCSRAIKALPFDERMCVFPLEFHLPHFPSYVGANCELNCRVSNMLKFCGCVTYFFAENNIDNRICTFKDIPCLQEKFSDILGRFRNTQCPCPNSCEWFDYDVQLSSTDLDLSVPTLDPLYHGVQKNFAVAHIFMNSQLYRRVRRDLLSNTVTLVSNLGSAFSLFVGMSLVSAVEILYYFTIVLRKNYRQEVKARDQILFRKQTEIASN